LTDIGNLEQEFVYGDATTKELIGILNSHPVLTFPRPFAPLDDLFIGISSNQFRVATVR